MKKLLFLLAWPLLAATTVQVGGVTATQAQLVIATDQLASTCSVRVSEGTTLGTMVPDVDATLFTGRNLDSRAGVTIRGGRRLRYFIVGTRITMVSSVDNRRYSLALQANLRHIAGVTCGADSEVTALFTTANPDSGITYQEPRFDRAFPGQWAYPSLDWTSRTKEYPDPSTGVAVKLATLPGDLMPVTTASLAFPSTIPSATDWTCVLQACGYSGTSQTKLLLQANAISNGLVTNALQGAGNANSAQLVVRLSGTAAAVLVCLTVDTATCAGGQVSQAITGTPTTYTIGSTTPVMESWRNGPQSPVSAEMMRTRSSSVTKVGTAITYKAGDFFPVHWGSTPIPLTISGNACTFTMISDVSGTVSSAGCAPDNLTGTVNTSGTTVTRVTGGNFTASMVNNYMIINGLTYVVATFTDANTVQLTLPAGTQSGVAYTAYVNMTANTFGFLLQASTASSVTIALASSPAPTWTLTSSGVSPMPSAGFFATASPVTFTKGGVLGNLYSFANGYGPPFTYNTCNPIFWTGQDGTTNTIGLSCAPTPTGMNTGINATEGMVWDGNTGGRFYEVGTKSGGVPNNALYRVDYAGDGSAATPAFDSLLPSSTSTVETLDINALVTSFNVSGDFATYLAAFPSGGWKLVSWAPYGTRGAILLQTTTFGQDYAGWQIMFGLDTSTVIAAMCSYCGAAGQPNRWGGIHSGFAFAQYPWTMYTINPTGAQYTTTSTGTLGPAPWSTCPANPFGVTGANCSTLTVGSITPLSGGSSLFGQTIQAGDSIQVNQECVRVMTISGTTIVVQRNQRIGLQDVGLCGFSTTHSADQTLRMLPSIPMVELYWNFSADPQATDATGTYLLGETRAVDCHYGYNSDTMILGCLPSNLTSIGQGKPVRLGSMPGNLSVEPFPVNWDARFSAASASGSDNYNETHPSNSQVAASTLEKQHFIDNRPFTGFGVPSSGVTLVGTYVYKVPAASLPSFNYRIRNWLVQSNNRIAVDKSAPAATSMLLDTSADWYKYCYALIAGECFSGSAAGETYVNFPYVSSLVSVPTRFVTPRNDIDISEWQHSNQSVVELDTSRGADPNGTGVRVLSSVFAPTRTQNFNSIFWNSREMPLGNWIVTQVNDLGGGQQQNVLIKKPPAPVRTSINNAEYISVPMSFSGRTGDTVRVIYGYAEYDQGQLVAGSVPPCHTRNEACATDGTGTQPYLWASETQQPTSCTSGCTVILKVPPAPGGRVVYYQVVRVNGGTAVVGPVESLIAR